MVDATVQWRTPTGVRLTDSNNSVSVDVEATVGDSEGGVSKVTFTVNGTEIDTVESWRRPTFNERPSPITGADQMSKRPFFGVTINAGDYAAGPITITAVAVSGIGTQTSLPGSIVIYNDKGGADTRPSPKTIYLNADTGDDGNDGLTRSTPKLNVQAGATACATSGDLSGAELVLTSSAASYDWAGGGWGIPDLGTTGDWPFTIRVEDGAKITRSGTVNVNSGGIIYSEPGDLLTIRGIGSGGDYSAAKVHIRMILEGSDTQIEDGDLKTYLHPSATGIYSIEGGISGSSHWSPSKKWSVRFVEDRTDLWDPAISGATSYNCNYYNHTRRGVVHGFARADSIQDCVVEDLLGIALQSNSQGGCGGSGIITRSQRYDADVAGLVDAELGDNVSIALMPGDVMRVTALPGAKINSIEGGQVTARAINIADQAAELVGSPLWGIRFDSGFAAANQGVFEVTATGTDGSGNPYFEVQNTGRPTDENPSGSAQIWTHYRQSNSPQDYIVAIHPDIIQWLADPVGQILSGVRCSDFSSGQGYFVSCPTMTRFALRDCTDGGMDLRNNFDVTSTFTDCVFEHLTFSGVWDWNAGATVVRNTIRKCVLDGYSDISSTGGNVVEDCHFITGSAIGSGSTTGAWFDTDPSVDPWDMTPLVSWFGGSVVSDAYYPSEIAWGDSELPTKGAWADVADADHDYSDPPIIPPVIPIPPAGPSPLKISPLTPTRRPRQRLPSKVERIRQKQRSQTRRGGMSTRLSNLPKFGRR